MVFDSTWIGFIVFTKDTTGLSAFTFIWPAKNCIPASSLHLSYLDITNIASFSA